MAETRCRKGVLRMWIFVRNLLCFKQPIGTGTLEAHATEIGGDKTLNENLTMEKRRVIEKIQILTHLHAAIGFRQPHRHHFCQICFIGTVGYQHVGIGFLRGQAEHNILLRK